MASIGKEPGGLRRILFVAPDGKRKTVRLGKMSQRLAEGVKMKVENLVSALLSGQSPDDETSRWLATLDSAMSDKLAKVGLIAKQARSTLKTFLDSYVASRSDVKGSTATVYGHTRRCLVEYFGAEKPLHEITADDAAQWRTWLSAHEKLADNTIRRRSGIAKQFFRQAIRQKLIAESPFVAGDTEEAKRTSVTNLRGTGLHRCQAWQCSRVQAKHGQVVQDLLVLEFDDGLRLLDGIDLEAAVGTTGRERAEHDHAQDQRNRSRRVKAIR